MADYVISDIHVKWDMTNSEPLKKFLSINYNSDDRIYFLGDIFDLMVGSYDEYEGHYDWFFSRIKEITNLGVKVFYVQGNHDFHIEELLKKNKIIVKAKPFVEIINNQKVLFCHGDEIEVENFNYRIWRAFIRSYPLALISKYVFNYKIVKKIGDYLSQKSRNRNEKRYGETQLNTQIRDKFRKSTKIASEYYNVDIIICGHSHYMDAFQSATFEYYNCGFVPSTMKYLKITDVYKLQDL